MMVGRTGPSVRPPASFHDAMRVSRAPTHTRHGDPVRTGGLSRLAGERARAGDPRPPGDEPSPPLKAGIIGLDTSHVVAFTQLLNADKPKPELAGVRVVAAYPGGSQDIPSSRDRVAGFTRELKEKYGVEIVGSIDELLAKVDVVLLESVDGRPHLEQARPVFQAHKPVFIDKPVAGSLADAIAIFDLARETGTPCFSSSSLRFSPGIAARAHDPRLGEVVGCETFGPCELEAHHPDLFWYGVHGVESLYTIMGTGCESVARTHTDGRTWPSASGRTAGSGRSAATARRPTSSAGPSSAPRGSPRWATMAGMSRWSSRSSSSSRPASRRSPPRRPSRSSPSWRPPTRASARAAGRSPSRAS